MKRHDSRFKYPPPFEKESVSKAYKCSSCNRAYSTQILSNTITGRIPFLMPCNHTICEECLRFMAKTKNISCKVCRYEMLLETNEALSTLFPVDRFLFGTVMSPNLDKNYSKMENKLKDVPFSPAGISLNVPKKILQKGKTPKDDNLPFKDSKTCSQTGCPKRAEYRCVSCSELYCAKCDKRVHESIRILRNHVRYPIEIADLAEFHVSCAVHQDSFGEYSCITCEAMLCSKCVIKDHTAHEVIAVEDKNAQELESFKEILRKGKAVLKCMEFTQKKVKQEINSTRQNSKRNINLESDIMKYFSVLHSQLQLMEQSILDQSSKAQEAKTVSLERLCSELDANIEIMHCLVGTGKLVVEGGKKHLDKLLLSELEKNISDNLILPCELIEDDLKKEAKVQFETDATILDTLQNHCHIQFEENVSFKLRPLSDFSEGKYDLPSDEEIVSSSDTDSVRSRNESESSGTSQISYIKRGCKTRLSLAGAVPTLYGGPVKQKEKPKNPNEPTVFVENTIETVTVTHLINPSHFYVQLSRKKKQIEELTNKYELYAEHAASPTEPEIGSTYLVQYTTEKFKPWYRAIVRDILATGITTLYEVFYIDYGNKAIVPLSKFRIIKPLFMQQPPFAYKCRLNGIISQRNEWNDDVLNYMLQFITANNSLKMLVVRNEKGILDVDLYAHNESLSTALIFMGYAQPVSHLFDKSKVAKTLNNETKIISAIDSYQKDKIYPIHVSHVVNPHCIYIQLFGNRKSIENLETAMTRFYEKKEHRKMIFTPEKGMICAAKLPCSNKNWWRVEILNLPGNATVEVFALDYGNTEIIPWSQLCKINDMHKQTDAQAIKVSLSDIAPPKSVGDEWSEEVIEFLRNYLKDKKLSIYVNQPSKEKLMVTMYEHTDEADVCIDALLVREELAESTGESSLLVEFHKILPGESEPKVAMNKNAGQIVKELKPMNFAEQNRNIVTGKQFTVDVKVLKLNSPTSFYVDVVQWENEKLNMHKQMYQFYSEQISPVKKWDLDATCVIKSTKDDKYYRGIITKILEDDSYEVFLKDMVLTEEVPTRNLFELSQIFATHDYTFHCKLGGLKSTGGIEKWSSQAIEIFEDFLNQHEHISISKYGPTEDKTLSVQLFTKWEETAGPLEPVKFHILVLNDILLSRGVAIPIKRSSNEAIIKGTVSPTTPIKTFTKEIESALAPFSKFIDSEPEPVENIQPVPPIPTHWLPPIKCSEKRFKAWISFVDFEGAIYYQTLKARRMLQNITRILNNHFKGSKPDPPHDWTIGQMCTVKYHIDKSFCRGTVVDITGEKIIVQLIDYGNQEDCEHHELRSEILALDIPILCIKCKLSNVIPKTENNKWSVPLLDRLHYTLVDKECEIIMDESEEFEDDLPRILLYLNKECINNLCNSAEWTTVVPKLIPKPDTDDEEDVIVEEVISNEDIDIEIADSSAEDIAIAQETLLIPDFGYKHIKPPLDQQSFQGFVFNMINYRTVIIEPEFAAGLMTSTKEQFELMSEEIEILGPEQPIIPSPMAGMPCIAIFGDDVKWYRAEILDVMDFHATEIKVLFIDYGNVEIVPREEVRVIRKEWLEIPVTMLICKIWGILKNPDYDEMDVTAAMRKAVVNENVKVICQIQECSPEIAIKIINEDTYDLVYKDVIDDGLIQSTD